MKALTAKNEISLIPLRDVVVFPNMIVPFFVGRKRSIRAVEEAMAKGRLIFLATQKQNSREDPSEDEIYNVGTISRILQMLKLPDGTIRLLVEGNERANIVRYIDKKDHFKVQLRPIKENIKIGPQISALMRTVLKEFNHYSTLHKKIPQEIVSRIEKAEQPDKLVNLISANIPLKIEKKIEILSQTEIRGRLENLAAILVEESEVLALEQKINAKVRKKLEKTQKEYFLNEQLKEIQKELGSENDDPTGVKELEEKLKAKGIPGEIMAKCQKDLKRLSRMQPISPESAVLRTYLEWITDLS
ncbi:Lon protease [subsurface metagenome]